MRWGAGFRRDQEGQTLVVIALAVTVLLGAVALGVDAGYGLTQRRVMQNAADAGTMAAAKMMSTSVVAAQGPGSSTVYVFTASKEQLWCRAFQVAQQNQSFGTSNLAVGIQFGADVASLDAAPMYVSSCSASTTTPVPATTRYIRVHATTNYRSLFAGVVGQPSTTAHAQARAHITGTPVAVSGPTWPMVRHYDAADFVNGSCGNPCDPTAVQPKLFWSASGGSSLVVYGNFKAAVDFSRYSTYYPYTEGGNSNVEQLIRSTDQTGTHPDLSANGNNCSSTWDARGDHNPTSHNIPCDVPNWFAYGFGGTMAVDTAWGTTGQPNSKALPTGQSALVHLGTRSICPAPTYIETPSCTNDLLGDWVEATGGNIGSNYSQVLADKINRDGAMTTFSNRPYPNKNQPCVDPGGPNESNCYGKALTMLIFLWDCAQDFNGGNWALVFDSHGSPAHQADCSQLGNTGNTGDVNRVHLFTAVPFTFYKALVNTSSIEGFWGGQFGSASSCPSGNCSLNPFSNSAYLDGE
jgi:Flp pilus assembly protein TadG